MIMASDMQIDSLIYNQLNGKGFVIIIAKVTRVRFLYVLNVMLWVHHLYIQVLRHSILAILFQF